MCIVQWGLYAMPLRLTFPMKVLVPVDKSSHSTQFWLYHYFRLVLTMSHSASSNGFPLSSDSSLASISFCSVTWQSAATAIKQFSFKSSKASNLTLCDLAEL